MAICLTDNELGTARPSLLARRSKSSLSVITVMPDKSLFCANIRMMSAPMPAGSPTV